MRRRRLLLAAGLLALLGVAGLLLAWLTPHPGAGITKENYERIREGMTFAEVEAILGPEGYQTKRPLIVPVSGPTFPRWWIGDDAIITIEFGPKGWGPPTPPFAEWQVTNKHYAERPPEPFLDRLRRLLPW
jgi:hypothetical protein